MRSTSAAIGVRREVLGGAVELEPGVEEPGGLRALTGEDDDDHQSQSCQAIGRRRSGDPITRIARNALCASYSDHAVLSAAAASRRRVESVPDRAEDERGLQDERLAGTGGIPADDLADALEAVAHGVGVHEQLARGRLERAAVVEVAPQRRHQVGGVRLQRAVDALDEGLLGQRVAGEGALGQQVVGLDGARGVAPGARDGEAGEGGAGALARVDERGHRGAEHEVSGAEPGLEARRDLEEGQLVGVVIGAARRARRAR